MSSKTSQWNYERLDMLFLTENVYSQLRDSINHLQSEWIACVSFFLGYYHGGSFSKLFIASGHSASLPSCQHLASCELQRDRRRRVVSESMDDLRDSLLLCFCQAQADGLGKECALKPAAKVH